VIGFRYHVVSLVAVILALALGLFLGSVSLQGTVLDAATHKTNQVKSDNQALQRAATQAREQLAADRTLDGALVPYAVAGRLSGQALTVVLAPGVSATAQRELTRTLQTAGAVVASQIRLSAAYLNGRQADEVGQLAAELHVPGVATASKGSARADAEIAAALGSKPTVAASTVASTLAAYADGKYLSVVAGSATPRPAGLAVVVAPAAAADGGPESTALLGLVKALSAHTGGAVEAMTGEVSTAANASPSDRHRISTVTGADQPVGQVATVLALAARSQGVIGSYGVGSATPLPQISPQP